MTYDKEHPTLLWYMLFFFLLLAVAGYLMLANFQSVPSVSDSPTNLNIPSYQNLFGSSQ